MPEPQKLPRKYLGQLQQAQEDLRLLAHQARAAYTQLGSPRWAVDNLRMLLREIESSSYRIALELTELKVVEDCSGCPCAPSRIPAQVHLLVLADELERQASLARQRASEGAPIARGNEERLGLGTCGAEPSRWRNGEGKEKPP